MALRAPARDARRPGRWGGRFRFLFRFLGLAGFVAAAVGANLFNVRHPDWPTESGWELLYDTMHMKAGDTTDQTAAMLVGFGALFVLLAVLIEVVSVLRFAAGRRSAAGSQVAIQVALAAVLLVGVNLYSFRNYEKIDTTRIDPVSGARQFTLPAELAAELKKLAVDADRPTTIVVYQIHKTFGQLSGKPDRYDNAAERKVVEKVQDLVAQFRELGPQFKVVVLDVEEEDFEQKLARATEDAPELRSAIDAAPENSIFFYADHKVQQLSFNEFYALDKTASLASDGGRGNLVMLKQGVGGFASKVLAVEERKPRVGIAVIHEVLTTHGSQMLNMAGVRRSLERHGFDVRDIVLKRWGNRRPEPAAYSFEESKLDRLESRLFIQDLNLQTLARAKTRLERSIELWKKLTLDQLTEELRDDLRGRRVTEEMRRQQIDFLAEDLADLDRAAAKARDLRRKAEDERQEVMSSERVSEERRISDVKEKFKRLIDDCDLLIVPRLTAMNLLANPPQVISPELYQLSAEQALAVREFLKAGKPVLACFGPSNDPEAPPGDLAADRSEPMEELLGELGFVLGRQTVLFDVEGDALGELRSSAFGSELNVEVPALDFESPAARALRKAGGDERDPNPVRRSMQVTARSVNRKLDLRLQHPRPVYFQSARGRPAFEEVFLITDRASWNEDNPFPSQNYTPRPPEEETSDAKGRDKLREAAKGAFDQERRGPFPIGVAVQTKLPVEWYDSKYGALKAASLVGTANESAGALAYGVAGGALIPADDYAAAAGAKVDPASVRVAVIGHGGLFLTPDPDPALRELTPAKEKLLLHTVNWLLNRTERLPRADAGVWQYPRVDLSEREQKLWYRGTFYGLPLLFGVLGVTVLLVRRMR